MENYNQQQQAVILKGIAQQILSMNVPSFDVVGKLFKEFNHVIVNKEVFEALLNESNDNYVNSINWFKNLSQFVQDGLAHGYCGKHSNDLTNEEIYEISLVEQHKVSYKK